MNNKTSFIELVKETVDLIRDSRPSDRGILKPQLLKLVRKDLIEKIPEQFSKFNLTQVDFIFLSVILIENNLCLESVRYASRILTDSVGDSLRMKIQLEQSIALGALSKFIETDERERLKVRPEFISEIVNVLGEGWT